MAIFSASRVRAFSTSRPMSAARPRSRVSPASSASPRTRARSAPARAPSPPTRRSRARCSAIPTAIRPSCAQVLGRHHGLDPARIVCGAGSDELISLLIRCYAGPGDEVLYSRHGFLMYPIGALAVGATPVAAPETRSHLRCRCGAGAGDGEARGSSSSPIPTIRPAPMSRARSCARLHAGLPPSVMLVIDAAYAEFVQRNDFEPGIVAGRRRRERGDDAHLLEDLCARGSAARLGLLPARASPTCSIACAGRSMSLRRRRRAGIAAVEDVAALDRAREHNDLWRPWLERELRGLGLEAAIRASPISCWCAFPPASAMRRRRSSSCARARSSRAGSRAMACPSICASPSAPRTRCAPSSRPSRLS